MTDFFFEGSPYQLTYDELSIPAGMVCGIVFPAILKQSGMLIGRKGIEYYSQVHMKKLNSYIHTLGMPIFIYGMLKIIPLLLVDTREKAAGCQNMLFTAYMTHYFIVDPRVGAVTSCVYGVSLAMAREKVAEFYAEHSEPVALEKRLVSVPFTSSVLLASSVMILQELVGHFISGDPPSRIEGIPNAILYAIFYSISHI